MIQTDKDLLLKDLCARLPYGVKCHIGDNKPYTLSSVSDDYDGTIVGFKEQKNGFNMEVYLSECIPYLFPMSSMTDEQKKELYDKLIELELKALNNEISHIEIVRFEINYYLKNHFDYNGFIDKGLAIDANGKNIY